MVRYHKINGQRVPFTAEEESFRDAEEQAWADEAKDRKLDQIKQERLERLQSTDYMANSDYSMPENIATWRQGLRDIPQNNTTEEQYNLILARDEDGNLTNEIWSKP